MFEYSVTVTNEKVLTDYQYLFGRAPVLVQIVTNKLLDKYRGRLLAALQKTPGPASYPIQWASERQRIAVIAHLKALARAQGRATNDFAYLRTGDMVQGYRVTATYGNAQAFGEIDIVNEAMSLSANGEMVNTREFVKGARQQGFHDMTGWTNEVDDILPIQEQMADEADDLLMQTFTVIETMGGI